MNFVSAILAKGADRQTQISAERATGLSTGQFHRKNLD
jgi:hypothetical protein